MTTRHRLTSVLASAVHAPSIHNSQPWRVRLDGDSVELVLDAETTPRLVDPIGRAALASIGAFAANVELLLQHHLHRATSLEWLPEGGSDEHGPAAGGQRFHGRTVARVSITTGPAADPDLTARLAPAIPHRRTTRRPLLGDGPTPQQWHELVLAADGAAAGLNVSAADNDLTETILAITAEADATREADPAYLAELQRWVDRRDATGVPLSNVGALDVISRYPGRDFSRSLDAPSSAPPAVFEIDPFLLVLHGPSDDARAWLAAGRTMQRIQLRATSLGLRVGVLGQALEEEAWRARINDAVTRARDAGHTVVAHHVLRLGRSASDPLPAATPRRPLAEVLLPTRERRY